MNEAILSWLNSDEKDYHQGLSLFLPICRNKYLFKHLTRESKRNRAKLEYELKKASAWTGNNKAASPPPVSLPVDRQAAPVMPPAPGAEIDLNNMTAEETAGAVEKLEIALGKMHNKKGMLSNSLLRNFDPNDKEGRRLILVQIDDLAKDMGEIRAKLKYHEKHGKLPPVVGNNPRQPIPLPEEPVKLKQMLLNERSNRTKIKGKLNNPETPEADRPGLEERYREKDNLITEIERRLHG